MSSFLKKIQKAFSTFSSPEKKKVETPVKDEKNFTYQEQIKPGPIAVKPIPKEKSEEQEGRGHFRKRENAVQCNAPAELLTQAIVPKRSLPQKGKNVHFNKTGKKK